MVRGLGLALGRGHGASLEVTQHRRMMQRSGEQIAELAERKGTDRATLIVADQDAQIRLHLAAKCDLLRRKFVQLAKSVFFLRKLR